MKMSNIIILSLLSLGLVTSFSFIYSVKQEIQFVEYSEIKGSENLTSAILELGEFTSIHASDQIKVVLSQGPPSIEKSAEDNLLDFLHVENQDGKLVIYRKFEKNVNLQQNLPMIVKVSNISFENIVARNQSEIIVNGVLNQPEINIELRDQGSVSGNFETSKLTLETSQQSNATLQGSAKNLILKLTDQSAIRAYGLNAEFAEIQLRNQAEAKINVSTSVSGQVSGIATLGIKGDPENKVEKRENARIF